MHISFAFTCGCRTQVWNDLQISFININLFKRQYAILLQIVIVSMKFGVIRKSRTVRAKLE